MFFSFLCFLFVILLFKMLPVPKHNVETLSSVPKKAERRLTEKIQTWGVSAAGYEFNVNTTHVK